MSSLHWIRAVSIAFGGALIIFMAAAQSDKREPIGYEDTPYLPDGKWRVHDLKRPHPRMVKPGEPPGRPPSDAVVLFDGKDLSQWMAFAKGEDPSKIVQPAWKVENGYMEVTAGSGSIFSKEKFGDCQIHVEWATPGEPKGSSQSRGNSGVLIMTRYEVQVLDSFDNVTYADGQAAAIYAQTPPMVNASRRPGEWQMYDIAFEAPRFEGDKLVKPAYITVLHNGVLVHHHREVIGRMTHRRVGTYAPHAPEEPFALQAHGNPVRYRNIWIRRLRGYDQP
jgi:hypothetical protein